MSTTPKYRNRVRTTSTTTGTGTYTVSGTPVAGNRPFSSFADGDSVEYCAEAVDGSGVPTGDYEIGVGTVGSGGTTLSRDKILETWVSGADGTTAVSWPSGTRRIFATALAQTIVPVIGDFGFRLSLTSGVSRPSSDVTSGSTLYLVPDQHNRYLWWNGSSWERAIADQISLALSGLTTDKLYDVYLYRNSGTPTLELGTAWTNDTTPHSNDALTQQDGVWVKSSDKTRLHIGLIRAISSTATVQAVGGTSSHVGGKQFVWNRYNQIEAGLSVFEGDNSWDYRTATIRQKNGQAGNKLEWITRDAATLVKVDSRESVYLQSNSSRIAVTGIGIDSITAFSGRTHPGFNTNAGGIYVAMSPRYVGRPGLGYHYAAELESGPDGSAGTFIGDNGGDGQQTGMDATLFM